MFTQTVLKKLKENILLALQAVSSQLLSPLPRALEAKSMLSYLTSSMEKE